jgi:hypothetical protein
MIATLCLQSDRTYVRAASERGVRRQGTKLRSERP